MSLIHTCSNAGIRPRVSIWMEAVKLYFLLVDVGSAEGLAYDTMFHELYWTSYSDSTINRVKVNPTDSGNPHEKEVQVRLGTDDHPRAIVLDSCKS